MMKDPFEIDLSEKDEQDLEELRDYLMEQHQAAREGRKARGGRGTDTTDDEVMRQTLDRVNDIDNELYRRDQQQEVTVGEFTPTRGAQDKAEGRFSSSLNRGRGRSQNAAIADKSKRAPVTTDFERWKSNKGELDFPGVDTPSASPDVRPKDLKQQQRPDTTEPTEDKRAVERAETTIGDSNLLESEAEASATDSDVVGAFVSGRAESRDVSVSRGEALRGERTDSIVSFAGPQFNRNEERVVETDRRDREQEMMTPEEAFMQSGGSVAEELNDLYADESDSGDSVPTRPYESRNDGPPSQVGPYELAQDKQNDGFRTVAFENKESDRSVVFQTYNTDLDGPGATVDVSYGDNTETIAEGDADSVYQQFIGELEERRDRNQEREPSDGSGIQSRANERLNAAQNLFGGDR